MSQVNFRRRAKEVRSYLRSLQAMEESIRPGRSFYRAAATITVSRASAFIMIYNSIEHAVREAIFELRSDIEMNGGAFDNVLLFWREEVIRATFFERLRQGTNHGEFLKEVARFMPGVLSWGPQKKELPFPGNIDHEELFRFVKRIGYHWRAPKDTLGGLDLELIRKMRNDLAHGHESFEIVGSQFTTRDIIDKFERIRSFMLSYLRMIDRYRSKQLYLH